MSQKIEIADDDYLSRAIMYPQMFPSGVFDITQCYNFPDGNPISVFLNRLTSGEEEIHELGLKVEKKQNKELSERFGGDIPSDKKRQYQGYKEAKYKKIKNCSAGKITFNVVHKEEHGVKAHCNLHMGSYEKSTKPERNLAREKLAGCFSDLIAYGC